MPQRVYLVIEGELREGYSVIGVYDNLSSATLHVKVHVGQSKKKWKRQKDGSFMSGCDYIDIAEETVQQGFGDEASIRDMYEDHFTQEDHIPGESDSDLLGGISGPEEKGAMRSNTMAAIDKLRGLHVFESPDCLDLDADVSHVTCKHCGVSMGSPSAAPCIPNAIRRNDKE